MVSPPGSEDVVICIGVTRAVIAILRFAEAFCVGELESLTATMNEKVPAVVGVPAICPALLSVKPPGREPALTDQV